MVVINFPFVQGFLYMRRYNDKRYYSNIIVARVTRRRPVRDFLVGFLKMLVFIAMVVIIATQAFIVSNYKTTHNEKSSYLLVLGARVYGTEISLSLKSRLDKALQYAQVYPDCKIIVSGGQGYGEDIAEAYAMKEYLVSKGIDSSRIITEDKAKSTYENFKFASEILRQIDVPKNEKITVVTNDFHIFRSKLIAKRQHMNCAFIAAPTPLKVLVQNHLRESFAIIKSLLMDF